MIFESIGAISAFVAVELTLFTLIGGVQNHIAKGFAELRDSIAKLEIATATDRANNEGRHQDVLNRIEGVVVRADSHAQRLAERISFLRKEIEVLEKRVEALEGHK